jgi:hypothetical protein
MDPNTKSPDVPGEADIASANGNVSAARACFGAILKQSWNHK